MKETIKGVEGGTIKRRNAVSPCKSLVSATGRNLSIEEFLRDGLRFERDAENYREPREKRWLSILRHFVLFRAIVRLLRTQGTDELWNFVHLQEIYVAASNYYC